MPSDHGSGISQGVRKKSRHRREKAVTDLASIVGDAGLEQLFEDASRINLPELLKPSDFINKTSIWYKRRGKETKQVDRHYADFYPVLLGNLSKPKNPSLRIKAMNLFESLENLRKAKGGDWTLVTRNVSSKGYLQEWHSYLQSVWADEFAAQIKRESKMFEREMKRSRFGVIHLLGQTKVDISLLPMILEGVGALGAAGVIGGVNGASWTPSAGSLDSVGGARNLEIVLGVNAEAAAKGGATLLRGIGKANHAPAKSFGLQKQSMESNHIKGPGYYVPEVFPHTQKVGAALQKDGFFPATSDMLGLISSEAKTIDSVTDIPGLVVGGTIGMGAAMVIDTGRVAVGTAALGVAAAADLVQGTVQTIRAIGQGIYQGVIDLLNKWKDNCFKDDQMLAKVLGAAIKSIAGVVVAKVCESAAPFVSGVRNLGEGLAKSLIVAKEKMGLWLQRRQVTLREGHFKQISASVEWQVTKGAFYGLWSMLKGAGDIAANMFLPGAGALVSVMMTAVEWGVKCLSQIREKYRINEFLSGEVRDLWDSEKSKATRHSYKGQTPDGKSITKYRYEPKMSGNSGSIIHNDTRFRNFFQKACDNSVALPMLTLNSGICGTITEQIEFFASGTLLPQSEYDAGIRYFSKLKKVSSLYLKSCGLVFRSDSTSIDDILAFAVRAHAGHGSTMTDKVLAGLAG